MTTDSNLKLTYLAFQSIETKEERVEYLKRLSTDPMYKGYDIVWDNLIKLFRP